MYTTLCFLCYFKSLYLLPTLINKKKWSKQKKSVIRRPPLPLHGPAGRRDSLLGDVKRFIGSSVVASWPYAVSCMKVTPQGHLQYHPRFSSDEDLLSPIIGTNSYHVSYLKNGSNFTTTIMVLIIRNRSLLS